MPREKRPRSRSPPRSSHSKRSVSTKDSSRDHDKSRDHRDSRDEFKKPVDKISKILRGNVRVPQNQALLEKSTEPSKADVRLFECLIYFYMQKIIVDMLDTNVISFKI